MTMVRGDYVRPNNTCLPRDTVWRVVGTIGGLELSPANAAAKACQPVAGLRFLADGFEIVYEFNDQWLPLQPKSPVMPAATVPDEELPKIMFAAAHASRVSAACARLKDAQKLEAERRKELREAKAAKAKADKEAAARTKVEEARRARAARLHDDRCLAEATLALIGEISRLNNGGSEQPAAHGIAAYCDQLQPLARSYGYRIAKPSMIALVVKL